MGFCLAVSELCCEDLLPFWHDLGGVLWDQQSDCSEEKLRDDSAQRDQPDVVGHEGRGFKSNKEQNRVKNKNENKGKRHKAISSLQLLLLPLFLMFSVRIVSRYLSFGASNKSLCLCSCFLVILLSFFVSLPFSILFCSNVYPLEIWNGLVS